MGDTWSIKWAAACAMCQAPHEGQKPRRLQLKATSMSWPQSPQSPQRSRRNPPAWVRLQKKSSACIKVDRVDADFY